MQHNAHTQPAKAARVKKASPQHGKIAGAMRHHPLPPKKAKRHHKQG